MIFTFPFSLSRMIAGDNEKRRKNKKGTDLKSDPGLRRMISPPISTFQTVSNLKIYRNRMLPYIRNKNQPSSKFKHSYNHYQSEQILSIIFTTIDNVIPNSVGFELLPRVKLNVSQ